MAMQMTPRESWWTKGIPREAWRLVLDAEQHHIENSPEGRKSKLITAYADGMGEMVYHRAQLRKGVEA